MSRLVARITRDDSSWAALATKLRSIFNSANAMRDSCCIDE